MESKIDMAEHNAYYHISPIKGRADMFRTYAYYHITPYDLGKTFTAIPRVPENRYGARDHSGDTEDPFTPRVCLSANLEGAALGAAHNIYGFATIYGTDTVPGFIDPMVDGKFYGSRNAPYGPDFSWTDYLGFKPSSFQLNLLGRMLKYCVPDAAETGEVWATKPVKLYRTGYLNTISGTYLTERPVQVQCVKPERLPKCS